METLDLTCIEIHSKSEDITKGDCVQLEVPYNFIQYLNTEDCKINKLCRICLSTYDGNMYTLYYTADDDILPEMFKSFTSICVQENDGLPSHICEICRKKVIYCHEFKEKCEKADYALKSFFKGEFDTKDEKCDKTKLEENENKNSYEKNNDKVKTEAEENVEDVQYLEDISDVSDTEALYIVQDINDNDKVKETKPRILANANTMENDKKTTHELFVIPVLKRKSKSKSCVCTICLKRFLNSKTLKAHVKRIHTSAEHPFSCNKCKDSFDSDHDLRLHMTLHIKGSIWKCIECSKVFKTKAMLRRHIYRHMQSKRYACEVCRKTFSELYALRRHSRVHTGEQVEKRHACNLCNKRYSESSALATHMTRHTGERPCVCAACGKAFPSARLLASHHLVHSDTKPYPCQYCEKRFRHESTRNTHHRTHTGEKPYVCSTCGKTFVQNSNLTLHMRTHTGEKPYACETCGRKFSSGSSLKNHLRSHTGEKPYACTICGKKFARQGMRAHMSTHTGERPYACSLCARTFSREARLREHCRLHTGEKPFECATCATKFVTKTHLVRHMKSHQSKKKKKVEREVVIVRQVQCDQPYLVAKKFLITKENDIEEQKSVNSEEIEENKCGKEITVEPDIPLEVSSELVLQDDSEIKPDLLVVDNSETSQNYQNETLCLNTNEVNFINNDINYTNDVNLVTVNEGEVSISASSAMLEGTTVKLYQLDQSLVQISTVGGQVTISKITSKMTANF